MPFLLTKFRGSLLIFSGYVSPLLLIQLILPVFFRFPAVLAVLRLIRCGRKDEARLLVEEHTNQPLSTPNKWPSPSRAGQDCAYKDYIRTRKVLCTATMNRVISTCYMLR